MDFIFSASEGHLGHGKFFSRGGCSIFGFLKGNVFKILNAVSDFFLRSGLRLLETPELGETFGPRKFFHTSSPCALNHALKS